MDSRKNIARVSREIFFECCVCGSRFEQAESVGASADEILQHQKMVVELHQQKHLTDSSKSSKVRG